MDIYEEILARKIKDLTASASALYDLYCLWRERETGNCHAPKEKVCSVLNLTDSTYFRAKKLLIEKGWIEERSDFITPIVGFKTVNIDSSTVKNESQTVKNESVTVNIDSQNRKDTVNIDSLADNPTVKSESPTVNIDSSTVKSESQTVNIDSQKKSHIRNIKDLLLLPQEKVEYLEENNIGGGGQTRARAKPPPPPTIKISEINLTEEEKRMDSVQFTSEMVKTFTNIRDVKKKIGECVGWFKQHRKKNPNKLQIKRWLAKEYDEFNIEETGIKPDEINENGNGKTNIPEKEQRIIDDYRKSQELRRKVEARRSKLPRDGLPDC